MSSDDEIEGFVVPFHASLAEPIMFGGVPRTFAIINGVFAAELTLGLGVWWLGIPVGIALHSIAFALHKRDPYFFSVLMRHIRQKEYWEA
jgi:type IV secretion system protein VirB3